MQKNYFKKKKKKRIGPSCCTDWRSSGGVRLATVRATKTINSLTLDRWKNPKRLTSDALANITGSEPSRLHFNTNNAVICILPFLLVFLCVCIYIYISISISITKKMKRILYISIISPLKSVRIEIPRNTGAGTNFVLLYTYT